MNIIRIIEILALIVFILLLVSVAVMPWPVNTILGVLILISFIVIIIYDRRAHKKE
ncbi:hypothetical protein ACFLW0_04105 [Chloroflexota bacterium]